MTTNASTYSFPPADPDHLARRALVRFVAGSLAALVVISFATLAVASRIASHEALQEAKIRGEAFATGVAAPLVTDSVRQQRPAAMRDFDRVMTNRLNVGNIAHIKVWSADGRVIYADQGGLEGHTYALPPGVQDQVGQDFTIAMAKAEDSRAEGDLPGDNDLLEVYVGTHDPAGRPVVLETYWTKESIESQYNFLLKLLAPLSLGALALLIVVVVPLGLSQARRLTQSVRERDRMLLHAVRASELERRRMAQTLHDGVIQDLAGLAYVLPTVTRHLPGDARGQGLRATLEDATALVRSDVEQLRGILADIYPPSLDTEGLEPALAQLAEWAGRSGIAVSVRADGVDELDHARMRLAFRVAREGVLNVVHHSGAEHAVVSVRSSDRDGLLVSVRDDGHNGVAGIPERESGHLGLRILHDVVVDLGGELRLRSLPEGGTELEASLPNDQDAEALSTLLTQ